MVGIICALYDESVEITRQLKFVKIEGIAQYSGTISNVQVSLFLTGPGIKKRSALVKWLRQHKFQHIINLGLAGALKKEAEVGESGVAGEVYYYLNGKENFRQRLDSGEKEGEKQSKKQEKNQKTVNLNNTKNEIVFQNINKRWKLLTVDQPIFSVEDKEHLLFQTGCDIVDMEGARLCQILTDNSVDSENNNNNIDKNILNLPLTILKVIGDTYDDEKYLVKEQYMRSFFSTFSFFKKINIIFQTGFSFILLYHKKKKLQKKLLYQLKKYLENRYGV